jgi:hypothetical protein
VIEAPRLVDWRGISGAWNAPYRQLRKRVVRKVQWKQGVRISRDVLQGFLMEKTYAEPSIDEYFAPAADQEVVMKNSRENRFLFASSALTNGTGCWQHCETHPMRYGSLRGTCLAAVCLVSFGEALCAHY